MAVPWRPILLVGLTLVIFYMVDTAAFTWGPIYLDDVVDAPSRLVALATFPYLAASGAVRLAGDGLVAATERSACCGSARWWPAWRWPIVVFAPTWPVAVLGFTILGGGRRPSIAPLSFSAAARIAGAGEPDPALRRARVDAVIARFNQFNYVGSLLGAVMIGVVGAGSLRVGFAVPMVLVLAILPLARAFDPR